MPHGQPRMAEQTAAVFVLPYEWYLAWQDRSCRFVETYWQSAILASNTGSRVAGCRLLPLSAPRNLGRKRWPMAAD